jgi:hypothetical protein
VYKSKPYRLNLNVNGTALQFKELVEKATGIAPQSQKLFGLTKGALKNETELSKLSIKEGQKLLLLSSAKPGRQIVQRVDVSILTFPKGNESLAIYHLPDEIIIYIFSQLNHLDLINCAQVCNYWSELTADNSIWESLFYDTWFLLEAPENVRTQQYVNWRSVYVGKYKQDKRWLNPFSEREVEEGGHVQFAHDNNPRQLLFVDMSDYAFPWCNEKQIREILVVSKGNQMQLINANTMRTEKTLRGHSAQINCFYARGKSIISADTDGNILLWDMTKSHSLPWSTASGELVGGMLKVDATSFSSLVFDDKWLIAGANEGTIRVWDLEKNTLVNQFYQCGPNPKITLYDNVVRTGDHMGEVLMFDLRVGKCVESFKGHTTSVLSLKAGGDWRPFTFYSHAATVKEWDTRALDHGCIHEHKFNHNISAFDTDGSRHVFASQKQLHIMTDNADRFMMEDKVIGFARGVEKQDIVVSQIGAKPDQAEGMEEDNGEDVENDMEVDEIEPEYNELESIHNFLTATGLDPNNPNEVIASRHEWRKKFAYTHVQHSVRAEDAPKSIHMTEDRLFSYTSSGDIQVFVFNNSTKKRVAGAYF